MRPLKLIFQHHLAVDLKRLPAFAAGFQVEPLFHHVGVVESFSSKSILFTRRQGFPERHKRPLSGILFSECQTFSFDANVAFCLLLDFFGLLAFMSLVGTFESGRQRDGGWIPERLHQKSGAAWLAAAVVPVVEFQHLANPIRWLRQRQFLSRGGTDAPLHQFAFQILWVDGWLQD